MSQKNRSQKMVGTLINLSLIQLKMSGKWCHIWRISVITISPYTDCSQPPDKSPTPSQIKWQHIFRHIFGAKFHSSLRLWQSLISFVQGKNVYYLHQNQDSVSDENKWILMADFLCDWRNTHITGTYVVAEDVRSYKWLIQFFKYQSNSNV